MDEANIDESDIRHVKPGQRVRALVRLEEVEDVLAGERWSTTLGQDGALSVPIARPAGFRWLRYRVR